MPDEILLYDTERSRQPLGNISIEYYSDGMPRVVMNASVPWNIMVLRPNDLASFMGAMFLVDAARERGLCPPVLVLPCLPGARQDRMNPEGDLLFTAKSIASEINMRDFPQVVCFDPHSDVMPALIDRCRVVHADTIFGTLRHADSADSTLAGIPTIAGRAYAPWAAVISPDGGAVKRSSAVARALSVPLRHAWKTRDVATGNITGTGIEPFEPRLPNERHLVVDDICDGGRTFTHLADEIGGNLDLYVSHGIFSNGFSMLTERFGQIITTNSIAVQRPPFIHEIDIVATLVRIAKDLYA